MLQPPIKLLSMRPCLKGMRAIATFLQGINNHFMKEPSPRRPCDQSLISFSQPIQLSVKMLNNFSDFCSLGMKIKLECFGKVPSSLFSCYGRTTPVEKIKP